MSAYTKSRIALIVFRVRGRLMAVASNTRSRLIRRAAWAAVDFTTTTYNFIRWTWATN